MKILLYGGCHALILRNLLEDFAGEEGLEIDLIINFELIASGRPFPTKRLDQCDALVFSPIENKGEYNTACLIDRCSARGIRTICFPWMEWHGYCPGAVKGPFKGRFQWFYPGLLDIADRHAQFESFVDEVITEFPDDTTIDSTFGASSERLASAERRHDMGVRISDFILEHHRTSRLFLVSDHPSRAVYQHALEQIADLLGLLKPPAGLPRQQPEPQWQWRTPILPRVERRLKLEFTDTQWVDDELVAGRSFDLETYLRLYFHRDSVILGPSGSAQTQSSCDLANGVDRSARIVASPLEHDGETLTYVCHEHLAGNRSFIGPNETFRIDPKQWTSTWLF